MFFAVIPTVCLLSRRFWLLSPPTPSVLVYYRKLQARLCLARMYCTVHALNLVLYSAYLSISSLRTAGQPCAHTSILHSIAITGNIMEVPHCLHVLGPCSAAAPKIEVLQDLLLYVLALLVPGTCWRTSCNYRRCFMSSYRLVMHYRQ